MINKLEIIEAAIEQLKRKEPCIVMVMIRQFVIENLPLPQAKEIDLYDYVDDGSGPKEVLRGVYMDKKDKVAVASNCQVLIVSKSMYKQTKFKNGVVGKDGKNIPGDYVNYKFALPSPSDCKKIDAHINYFIEKETVNAMADKFLADDENYCASIPIYHGSSGLQFPVSAVPLLLKTKKTGWKIAESKHGYYYEDDDLKIMVAGVFTDK